MLKKVKPLVITSLVLSTMITPSYASREIDIMGLTRVGPTPDELDYYWKSYQTDAYMTKDFYGLSLIDPASPEAFEIFYSDNCYDSGNLSYTAMEDTLHLINTMRFMAGVDEVNLDRDKNILAQDAAYISYLNNSLSHYPQRPAQMRSAEIYQSAYMGASSSNLSGGYYPLLRQVVSQMRDSSGQNYRDLGHRRWLLNPYVSSFGLGATEGSGAIHVVDPEAYYHSEVIAFPSMATYSQMFGKNTPWSLQVGKDFGKMSKNIRVEVKDLDTNKIRVYKKGQGLIIDEEWYGDTSVLIFGRKLDTSPGKTYQVIVKGLRLNGKSYPVSYGVVFHSCR